MTAQEETELIESVSFGKFGTKFEDFSKLLFQNQRGQVNLFS
jgi:hypothetical protein